VSRRALGVFVLAAGLLGLLATACRPAPATGSSATTASQDPSDGPAPANPAPTVTAPADSIELTVYAAASLRDAVEAIVGAYGAVEPGITLTVSTGASSALRAQIEQGAPADVFLSADTEQPAALVAAGLTAGEAEVFAGNGLALIVPTANPAAIATPADLARPGVKIIAAGDAVPITTYATELVTRLAALDGYPPGFVEAYAANVVSHEDDVKAVVAKIELGEGDAAIVYRTDAVASTAVATIEIPPAAEVAASYAGVVGGASRHVEAAGAFLDWLGGPDAQAILASFGFSLPGS
jgi:molybdate transport system substrate-binding protein